MSGLSGMNPVLFCALHGTTYWETEHGDWICDACTAAEAAARAGAARAIKPTMTLEELQSILRCVSFLDRKFLAMPKGDGFLVQLTYFEADVHTGQRELQKSRKWYVSSHASKSEVVQTLLKACLTSAEHIVREHFTYKGVRVFQPHYDVEDLVLLCRKDLIHEDRRAEPPEAEKE